MRDERNVHVRDAHFWRTKRERSLRCILRGRKRRQESFKDVEHALAAAQRGLARPADGGLRAETRRQMCGENESALREL